MPPKTAKQLIEDEVKEFRRELMRSDVTNRSELKSLGYETWEIDEEIQQEREEVERQVDEYRSELMSELPERQNDLEEEREFAFAIAAFEGIWLPNCLMPTDTEPSGLVTKDAYEHYLSWCEAVGVSEPYSLGKVRNALKSHYGIENIRTGLKAYRLVEVTTKVNRNRIISQYESEQRRQEREASKLRDLICTYCERRRYDGNRFDRCYWCNRILKDGFRFALSEYMSEGEERTGESMRLAYRRMVGSGEISDPDPYTALPASADAVEKMPHPISVNSVLTHKPTSADAIENLPNPTSVNSTLTHKPESSVEQRFLGYYIENTWILMMAAHS